MSDTVIMMDNYKAIDKAIDVTKKAQALARDMSISTNVSPLRLNLQKNRKPLRSMISAKRGKHERKFDVKNLSKIAYGEHQIPLST